MHPEPATLFKAAPFCDGSGATDGGLEIEDGGFAGVAAEGFGGKGTVAGDGASSGAATGGVVIGDGAEAGGTVGAETGGKAGDGGNEVGEGEDAGDWAIVETNKAINMKQTMLDEVAIVVKLKRKESREKIQEEIGGKKVRNSEFEYNAKMRRKGKSIYRRVIRCGNEWPTGSTRLKFKRHGFEEIAEKESNQPPSLF